MEISLKTPNVFRNPNTELKVLTLSTNLQDEGHRAYKENTFTMSKVQQWKMLFREVVQSSFLEVFNTRLDKALSNWSDPIASPA